jgi:hypothetical protein
VNAGRRTIRRSRLTSSREVAQLLQNLMIAELLRPSVCLWIVSPWITDIGVIDNSTLSFDDLGGAWGPRTVRLSEVLLARARFGSALVIATRLADPHNAAFLNDIKAAFGEAELDDEFHLVITDDDLLHEKGIAGDSFYLSGSMNLTYTGVHIGSEMVTLDLEAAEVARARRSFFERFGGTFNQGQAR